jgi:hypothetical protein
MKFRGMGLAAGIAVLAGLLLANHVNGRTDSDEQRVRLACLTIGEVARNCDLIMPDVPACIEEDCSDIRAALGYWRDKEGRLYLIRSPWTIIASQDAP